MYVTKDFDIGNQNGARVAIAYDYIYTTSLGIHGRRKYSINCISDFMKYFIHDLNSD